MKIIEEQFFDIQEKIIEISLKYKKNEFDEIYNFCRYEDDVEFLFENELKDIFKNKNISHQIIYTHAYYGPSIEVDVISVSWVQNNKLEMKTFKIVTD